jgi:uncharacterized protein (DUF58 family)
LSGWFSGLTTRGRCLLAAGVAAALCALLLNERDLLRVAVFVIALPVLAAMVAGRARLGLSAQRRVAPRIPVGEPAQVELALSSHGRLPAGGLLIEDGMPDALGSAPRFVVERVSRHGTVLLRYPISPVMRGVHALGPLVARVTDPFGLAEFGRQLAGHTRLVVVPAVHALTGLPAAGGRGLGDEGAGRLRLGQGEDDAVVRPFRQGDDLRKVHWRSTARRDELMVRVEEAPWRGGTTVLLDRRSAAHRGSGPAASLEWAVSMAGSVCLHLLRHGHRIRLITEDGALLAGGGDADNSADAVLDALAGLQTSALYDLAHCRPLRDSQDVIAILGGTTVEAAAELLNSRARATRSRVVLLDVNRWASAGQADAQPLTPGPDAAARLLGDAGWGVVIAGPHQPMDAVWRELCDDQHAVLAAAGR